MRVTRRVLKGKIIYHRTVEFYILALFLSSFRSYEYWVELEWTDWRLKNLITSGQSPISVCYLWGFKLIVLHVIHHVQRGFINGFSYTKVSYYILASRWTCTSSFPVIQPEPLCCRSMPWFYHCYQREKVRIYPSAPLVGKPQAMRNSPLSSLGWTNWLQPLLIYFPSTSVTIFIPLLWMPFNSFIFFLYCGTRNCVQYSRWGSTSVL